MHGIGETRAEARKPKGGVDVSGLDKFKKCVSVFLQLHYSYITNFVNEFKY